MRGMSFIQALFKRYDDNEKTRPLIKAACDDYNKVIQQLEDTSRIVDVPKRIEKMRFLCQEYAEKLAMHMTTIGNIGPYSQHMVIRDVVSASMLLNSVYFTTTAPSNEARAEQAQVLLLQARLNAVMMICAADAGTVFG